MQEGWKQTRLAADLCSEMSSADLRCGSCIEVGHCSACFSGRSRTGTPEIGKIPRVEELMDDL